MCDKIYVSKHIFNASDDLFLAALQKSHFHTHNRSLHSDQVKVVCIIVIWAVFDWCARLGAFAVQCSRSDTPDRNELKKMFVDYLPR